MNFNLMKKAIVFIAPFLLIAPIESHASTSQFVARLYTEALGRAPDQSGWKGTALAFPQSGTSCQGINFLSLANTYYGSAEYNNLGYTSLEKVLTIYRGILNREPDSLTTMKYWSQLLDAGTPMSTILADFISSSEFVSLRNNQICTTSSNVADPAYRWGTGAAITINDGETGMTSAYVQGLLNAAQSGTKVVSLPPRAVIFANQKITIPAGVTLTTAGVTNRQQYARMARIVRTGFFGGTTVRGDQSLVSIESGGKLSAIWVSGQREAVVSGTSQPYVSLATNVFMRGGTGTTVQNSRVENTTGGTNISIDGNAELSPCSGAVIDNNLVTGYMNTHYTVGGVGKYSDGVTVACESTTITNNHVVDASDVGIILFRSGSVAQASQVHDNIIVSSGISSYAAMAYEPYSQASGPAVVYSFTGSSFYNNQFWTSGDSHFDIGMAAGTKAWGITNNTGTNGTMINNSNEGIASVMQVGIGVDGMVTTTISGNSISYVMQTNGTCPTKAAIVAISTDPTRGSPTYINQTGGYTPGALDGCHMGGH
jgi:hypothetical protein